MKVINGTNVEDIDIAYTAGIVDGEGTITICVWKKDNGKTFPYAIVQIFNTNYDLIDWLYSTFGGGSLHTVDRGNGK